MKPLFVYLVPAFTVVVTLWAVVGAEEDPYLKDARADFKCPAKRDPPTSCRDVHGGDGKFVLIQHSNTEYLCDAATDGGGWTVIQRRANGQENFYREWVDYKIGFGSFEYDFWLGLEKIHQLTTGTRMELRIDLTFNDHSFHATYPHFTVLSEADNYRLNLGHTRPSDVGGTAEDCLFSHNQDEFSTKDRDNDRHPWRSCAHLGKAGWWYGSCWYSNLNGVWKEREGYLGRAWPSLNRLYGDGGNLTRVEMKIRPASVTYACRDNSDSE